MLISEIKNKEVRELAEHYARNRRASYLGGDKTDLCDAFTWDKTTEGYKFWRTINDGAERELPPTVPAEFDMPRLPPGWKYTRKIRQANPGEFILYRGEIKEARGQAGEYPIVVRISE